MKLKIIKFKTLPGEHKNRYFLQLQSEDGSVYKPNYNEIFINPILGPHGLPSSSGMFAAKTNKQDEPWTEFIVISGILPEDTLTTHKGFASTSLNKEI